MKILTLDKKNNFIKLKIDNMDDLWILSRVIDVEDKISGETFRSIKKTAEQEAVRKKIYIKIIVEKIDFNKDSYNLRLLGTITESENTDVPNGSHHTITITPGTTVGIAKKEFKKWQIERIEDAVAASKRPKVLLCAADYGEAHIAVIQEFGIKHLTEISKTIPGKKKETLKLHEKGKEDFLIELAKTLEDILKSQKLKNVIIGSTGFFNESMSKTLEKFKDLKKKVAFVTISSSGKTGINEIIKRGAVEKIVKGSRITFESMIVEKFFEEVAKDGLAVYGNQDVKEAISYGAVETLLVPDLTIQDSKESGKYKELEDIMISAEKQGAKVIIISSEHESGERISKMGVAAILRFKI